MKFCPSCGWPTQVRETRTMTSGEIFRVRRCSKPTCDHKCRTAEYVIDWDTINYNFENKSVSWRTA